MLLSLAMFLYLKMTEFHSVGSLWRYDLRQNQRFLAGAAVVTICNLEFRDVTFGVAILLNTRHLMQCITHQEAHTTPCNVMSTAKKKVRVNRQNDPHVIFK
jgi:hypothetical protein